MATKDKTFFGPPVKDWSEQAYTAQHLGFNLLRDFEPMMHELLSKAINHLNSLARTLDGGYDVNTPHDYQYVLRQLGSNSPPYRNRT